MSKNKEIDILEDSKIPGRVLKKVQEQMKWTLEKTYRWYQTDSPMMGGISPSRMWAIGRGKQMEKAIDFWIWENYREPMGEDDLD